MDSEPLFFNNLLPNRFTLRGKRIYYRGTKLHAKDTFSGRGGNNQSRWALSKKRVRLCYQRNLIHI